MHSAADRGQLVLSLVPLALRDHLLHLCEFGLRRQLDLLVMQRGRLTEQHGVHPVKRIPRMSGPDHGAKPAERQHRGGHRADHRQRAASALASSQPDLERNGGLLVGNQRACRRPSQVVAPLFEQRGQQLVVRIGDVDRLSGGERVEEPVAARYRLQRRLICRRPTETEFRTQVRHSHAPLRRSPTSAGLAPDVGPPEPLQGYCRRRWRSPRRLNPRRRA